MPKLEWTDPETGRDASLDVSGWELRITLDDHLLARKEIVPWFLTAAIAIHTEGEYEILTAITEDEALCKIALHKQGHGWSGDASEPSPISPLFGPH